MAPGAVPVINFLDDDGTEQMRKNTPMDILDDHDDYDADDDYEDYARLHKRSNSSNNFDNMFSHNQANYNKDQDDSDCASRNSATHVDNSSNAENEFKILMYLEDRNELAEGSHDSDKEYSKAAGKVQVEKKLDTLFKQEVPLTSVYYDKEGNEVITTTKKESSSEQTKAYYPIEGGKLNSKSELSLVKESNSSSTEQASRSMKIENMISYESMPNILSPMMPTTYNMYSGFEPGAFLFPFNIGQMAFQCADIPPQMMDVPKKKPIILDQTQERFTGKLKFFDEIKGYGFIVKEDDDKDIFCHYDDFCKANINISMLRAVKIGQVLRLSFSCLSYIGRHNKSKKAVDLQFISLSPNPALTTMAGMSMLSGLNSMAMVQMSHLSQL